MPATDDLHLYQQIAESIRREIIEGRYRPGERLPGVRAMTSRWGCTPGTVQRAYQELARQGLIVSRPGQGTRVADSFRTPNETPLRRAALVHRAESFLLEVLTAGYSPGEVECAVRLALDRWRALESTTVEPDARVIRFCGSHDPAVDWLSVHLPPTLLGRPVQIQFSGSLGGLIALAEGKADLAGCHLWDAETDSYNAPYVRRLLPNRRVALVTLAHRRFGLILPPGNPLQIKTLADLQDPQVKFINRQSGSGTRVWFDASLHNQGIDSAKINGYAQDVSTHSEVARLIAEGQANAAIGLESAASSYGLDFIFLAREQYDLIIPADTLPAFPVDQLAAWLQRGEVRAEIEALIGYDTTSSGQMLWLE